MDNLSGCGNADTRTSAVASGNVTHVDGLDELGGNPLPRPYQRAVVATPRWKPGHEPDGYPLGLDHYFESADLFQDDRALAS